MIKRYFLKSTRRPYFLNFAVGRLGVLALILACGALSIPFFAQTTGPSGQKPATAKPAHKVWTNDDFPQAPPESKAAGPKGKEETAQASPAGQPATPGDKGAGQPKAAEPSPADPAMVELLKLTPEQRQQRITDDESDIRDDQAELDALRSSASQAADDTQYQQILKRISQNQEGEGATRHELELLRKLSSPPTESKDAGKDSAPPSNQ